MKKYENIIPSKAIRGMKLKLYRNVHNISLYKNYVFYYCCLCTLDAMALVMRKMKICIYCYLVADILANVFQKCLLSSPLPNIQFLSKTLTLIGSHGNRKAKFVKKKLKKKIISSEAISGMKLCRNIHNSSLYKSCVFYCCCLCTLVAMATSSSH